MRICLVVAFALATFGCATERLDQERRQLAGHPVGYQDGYVDGCSTGTHAAGNPYYQFKKDTIRFESDKQYSQGWTDGFNICKADYESITRRRW